MPVDRKPRRENCRFAGTAEAPHSEPVSFLDSSRGGLGSRSWPGGQGQISGGEEAGGVLVHSFHVQHHHTTCGGRCQQQQRQRNCMRHSGVRYCLDPMWVRVIPDRSRGMPGGSKFANSSDVFRATFDNMDVGAPLVPAKRIQY
ncbi:hypothetical protein GGTG_08611 [Gaeumannomyces tritici R3-111a-1]|uniref:Uncharacterized protein n=1 Tax=Gaeumannomyces tritici (strain R3-111a-1) TaxID=644352 RepID=J3P525_GAET3|nr:hypothetical protein GGTG_08611 [Gaeumannomyces tritici R3-111a-1]EJT74773.1 hypothetical protein GGTG_08611 [Gaeumannomyces tritici R3-111a-1]